MNEAIKQYVADNDITMNDVVGYVVKVHGRTQTILSRSVFIMLETLPSKLTYRKFLKSVGLTTDDISEQYYIDHVHILPPPPFKKGFNLESIYNRKCTQ